MIRSAITNIHTSEKTVSVLLHAVYTYLFPVPQIDGDPLDTSDSDGDSTYHPPAADARIDDRRHVFPLHVGPSIDTTGYTFIEHVALVSFRTKFN